MFFRLGAVNAWRNLARSILAVVSMAVAAAFLTYTISLSRGYTHEAFSSFRQVLGGEIVVYAQKVQGEMPSGDSFWSFSRPTETPFTDLAVFHPEIFKQGYLDSSQSQTISPEHIKQLADESGVDGVSPVYRLPAFTMLSDQYRYQSDVRARDIQSELPINRPESLIYSGRWFVPEDEGQAVAVVSRLQELPPGVRSPEPGSQIILEFPSVKKDQFDQIYLDYSQPIHKKFSIIGNFVSPTREYSWQGDIDTQTEILYWWTNEIQIPYSTWLDIWREAAGELEYPVSQLILQSNDLTYLEDIVLNLVNNYPEYSFVSVPNQSTMAMERQLIEKFLAVPQSMVEASVQKVTQQGMAMDLRLPMMILVLLNAALLVAANMLIMINERKREMAILKSVGAKRIDITVMALTEALIIAIVGASIGFLFFRIPGALNQMTNSQGLITILQSVVVDLVQVLSATAAVSLLFGLIPAVKLAGMSVMNVLRSE
jgi:hypothetical protein